MTGQPNLILCAVLVAGGIAGYFLQNMADLEAAGTILSPWAYLKRAPYRSATAVLGAYLFMLAMYYMGQLNPLASIFIGVACGTAFNSLRARAVRKIKEGDEPPENGP